MLSGQAQSSPLVTALAVDIVSTSDSPSVSARRQPIPKSRMNTWPPAPAIRFDGFSKPWIKPC